MAVNPRREPCRHAPPHPRPAPRVVRRRGGSGEGLNSRFGYAHYPQANGSGHRLSPPTCAARLVGCGDRPKPPCSDGAADHLAVPDCDVHQAPLRPAFAGGQGLAAPLIRKQGVDEVVYRCGHSS
jgi:hypothetical protein